MYFLYILYVHFLYSVLCITNVHFCDFESYILRILFYISIILLINEAVVVHLKIIYAYSLIYMHHRGLHFSLFSHYTFRFSKISFFQYHILIYICLCVTLHVHIYIFGDKKFHPTRFVRTNKLFFNLHPFSYYCYYYFAFSFVYYHHMEYISRVALHQLHQLLLVYIVFLLIFSIVS